METFILYASTYWYVVIILVILFYLLIDDLIFQPKNAIRTNFPVLGRMRYLLELIGPELCQYWLSNDKEEAPVNRDERRWVYASAKGANKNFGFGTTEQLYTIGYPLIKHTVFPFFGNKGTTPTWESNLHPLFESYGRNAC